MNAVPFAGLAPDARRLRGGGELETFDLEQALHWGRELSEATSPPASTAELALKLVDRLNAFEHEGRPANVLVQAFVCGNRQQLPAELRASTSATPAETRYLWLVATRGLEAAWNDVSSPGLLALLPLEHVTDALSRQLQPDSDPRAIRTLLLTETATSPAFSTEPIVSAYGVRTLLAFALALSEQRWLVVVGHLRCSLDRRVAESLELVALYARLSWLDSPEGKRAAGPDYEGSRAAALHDVLSWLAARVSIELQSSRTAVSVARAELQRLATAGGEQLVAHNVSLRRTQRAMLNLIDDLRSARAALATKVDERTRELALANTRLEARNRDLEDFVYIASHDLQEPLRTVVGYLQMVERRYAQQLGPDGDEFIRFAVEGAQRMQALLDSLLFYSRVATKHRALELIRLDSAMDEALKNLGHGLQETGAVLERLPLPSAHADRMQMVQLFQNLIANALKFAGDKPPHVYVSGELRDGVCTIEVRDEGVGFDPRFAERIFKLFRRLRRDTPGTGIGLSVCKKIVERHGGQIEARSQPGQGTTFIVRIPELPDESKQ